WQLVRWRVEALLQRARSSYALGDYGDCEAATREALAVAERYPERRLIQKRATHQARIQLAKALSRLRRFPEAAQVVEPSVAFHRALKARNTDDFTQHVELADALFASYLADPRARAAERTEAMRLL